LETQIIKFLYPILHKTEHPFTLKDYINTDEHAFTLKDHINTNDLTPI